MKIVAANRVIPTSTVRHGAPSGAGIAPKVYGHLAYHSPIEHAEQVFGSYGSAEFILGWRLAVVVDILATEEGMWNVEELHPDSTRQVLSKPGACVGVDALDPKYRHRVMLDGVNVENGVPKGVVLMMNQRNTLSFTAGM